ICMRLQMQFCYAACRALPPPTLFAYTPLFRSRRGEDMRTGQTVLTEGTRLDAGHLAVLAAQGHDKAAVFPRLTVGILTTGDELRSEEHTSELQSRENLVCRLLLEKKNKSIIS